MKRIIIVLLAGVVLFWGSTANAAVFASGDNYVLPQTQSIDSNLYASAGSVIIAGPAKADLFLAGGSVSVTGTVAKDLYLVGGNINILNDVGEDLRVAGGNITIGAKIEGETMAAGGQIVILPTAVLNKNLYVAGGQVIIDGAITGDVFVRGGSVSILGTINGNVDIIAKQVVIGDNAVINGVLKYKSSQETIIPATAKIQNVEYSKLSEMGHDQSGAWYAGFVLMLFLRFIITTVVALILFLIFKKGSTSLVLNTFSGFWKKVLTGFIAIILIPIAAIIVAVTIIGLPLTMITFTIYMLLHAFACLATGAVVGTWVFSLFNKDKENKFKISWVTVLVGNIVLLLLALIPVVGWICGLIFFLATFGQLFTFLREWLKRLR